MKKKEAYVQIERYLNGQLSGQDLADFEQELAADPVLAEEFRQYKEVAGTLRFYHQRQSLKQKLQAIHGEMEPPAKNVVTPFGGKEKRRIFWNQHYATIAVAASVAILTVFGTLLSVDLYRSMGKTQAARYSALRREVEGIKQSQRAIIRGINSSDTKPAPKIEDPGNFSGTGFVISTDGYLVTSFHVVNGADSVFIENRAGQRYKVKSIYRDQAHDLAILKIEDDDFTAFSNLPYAFKSGDSDLGEKVYTLGYPREDMVFGEGSLSSRTGFEGDTTSYQISIPVNPGNSGGPLLDNQGNLIGVISGKQLDQQGAAFAVKSNYLKQLVEKLSKDSLDSPIKLSKKNMLAGTSRTKQLKKIEDYVFVIKVYNK